MHPFDWTATLLDEIALEGLDGITFQALWLRLETCRSPFFAQPLTKPMKDCIWNAITRFKDVQFFVLPEPRPPLVIFDWFCENDSDESQVQAPEIIYKHHLVDDTENGIMGSCPTYETRIEVSKKARKMSLDEAYARWGQKLVMVASQKVRLHALLGPSADPFMDLFCLPFCMLERIGRSRYNGEITNSKYSLQAMGLDPKNIFYHRKYLSKRKLITKQFFFVTYGSPYVTGNGNLLHLPRFFVEYESRMLFYLNVAVEHLKQSPNYTDTAVNIIKVIGNVRYRKRIFKSHEFSELITDEHIPYQKYYPNATKKECTTSKGAEKEIRVMRLKYPDVNVREFFNQLHEDDDDDEDDEDGDGKSLFPDTSNRILDRTTLTQAYQVIEEAGPIGLSTVELGQKLGFTRLMSRMIIRLLRNQGYIDNVAIDRGKIRVLQFISLKYGKNTLERKKIFQEQEKTAILLDKLQQASKKRKQPMASAEKDITPLKISKSSNEQDQSTLESEISAEMDSPLAIRAEDFDKGLDNESKTSFLEAQDSFSSMTTLDETRIEHQTSDEKIVDVSITPVPTYQQWDVEQILKKKLTSHRMFRRMNLILEAVQKDEIITSFFVLKKKIMKAEESDEHNVQIDKKTLIKLVLRLEAEGHLKTYSYLLKAKSRLEKITIICLPHITPDNPTIRNAIDHAKLRMSVVSKEKVKAASKLAKNLEIPVPKPDAKNVTQDLTALSTTYLQNFRNVPKFLKMQLTHQLLFYLVHFYEGDENLDQEAIKSELSALADLDTIKDVTLPKVYHFSKTLNWKLFIPPSPKHADSHKGWITIGELVLRMPLSLLVQICSLNYLIPEIYDYLSHPVYKHILLKDLPITIRSALTFGRVYVMAIHRVLTLLCYLGLVQFGPHRHRDKDLVQVYLNRHASLYNTINSKRGYIHISPDVEYPKITYHFQSIDDVNQYWIDAMMFCTNTQLGSREEMSGKSVVIETLDSKPDMIKTTTERAFDQVEQCDTGDIPGDGKGAAGFDSAFYAHLKRNWHWSNSSQRKPIKLHPYLESSQGESTPESPFIPKVSSTLKTFSPSKNPKRKIVCKKVKLASSGPSCVSKQFIKNVPCVRKFKEKAVIVRKPFYDEIDKLALANMTTERTRWSTEEDNVLLLIKVSALFFNQKNQRCVSYYRMARDFLHQKVQCSRNKTSRAVQRRLLFLMRRPQVAHVISVCCAEIQADQSLRKQFAKTLELCSKGDPAKDESGQSTPEKNVSLRNESVLKAMGDLTEILLSRYPRLYFSSLDSEGNLIPVVPDSVEELKSMYDFVCPALDIETVKPVAISDVVLSVITNLIYSSICCQAFRANYSLQLFYAFKHYPEKYLRAALAKLQTEQMISKRKNDGKYSKMKVSSFLPISSSCFQLSNTYNSKLMAKYQHIVLRDAFSFSVELGDTQPLAVSNYDGGKAAIFSSLIASNMVSFTIDIPEQLITLNPALDEGRLADLRLVTRMKNHFLGSGTRLSSSKKKNKDASINLSDSEDSDSDFENSIFENFPMRFQSSPASKEKKSKESESSDISNLAQNFKSEDLFLVKGCQFSVKLKDEDKPRIFMLQEDDSYRSLSLEEFQSKVAKPALKEFTSKLIYEAPTEEDTDKAIAKLKKDSRIAKELLAYIETKKDIGAVPVDIGKNFGSSSHIYSILRFLVKNRIIIKTGTSRTHYVHYKYSRPWFVHSFQMTRLDREKLDVEAISNVVEEKNTSEIIDIKMNVIAHDELPIQPLIANEETEEAGCSSEQINRTKKDSHTENYRKIKSLAENSKKQVQILIRPWVRPDGCLNRRVLDRFLGAVLSRAMEKPFCTVRSLQEKLRPLLEPAYTFELIELLVKIGCLVLKAKVVTGRINLFSSSSKSVKLVSASGLEKEEELVICVSVHAIVALSHFIGKAEYATDFMV